MENVRRAVQIIVFVEFLRLFALTIGVYDPKAGKTVLGAHGPVDIFFQLDPLLSLTTMLSTRQPIFEMLVLAVPVLILTVLFGRFFCGWICPMGTTLDATDALFFRKRRSSGPSDPASAASFDKLRMNRGNGKYYILAALVVAAVFSGQIAYFFDPFAILTRAMTFVVFPVVQLASRGLAGSDFVAERLPLVVSNQFLPADVQYFYRLNFLAAIVFIGILAANSISRRYWCRNLCPLGALLGLVSKVSIIRRVVKPSCVKCSKCIPDCKMGAINADPTQYQAPECIYCYSCTSVCPALSTRIVPTIQSEGYHSNLDLNRRRTLQAFGIGAMVAVLGKTNPAAKTSRNGKTKLSSTELIRPPGAVVEDEFVDRCVRCSECMKVCPTGGLQPALTEAGFEGLWSPVLVPRIGECTQNCNLCSQVCPSDAIQPFEIPEKSHIYIGRAVIDRSQCIAWNSDKQCLVCDEHCSYHALYWKSVDGVRRPFVDEYKCVGCGICENACPIQPVAAIRAFSFGDQRHKTREQQKGFLESGPQRRGEKPPDA